MLLFFVRFLLKANRQNTFKRIDKKIRGGYKNYKALDNISLQKSVFVTAGLLFNVFSYFKETESIFCPKNGEILHIIYDIKFYRIF